MTVNGKQIDLETDALIIGAGPGGCACAIQLLKQGKKVVLVDKAKFPRQAPGETLHPAIEPLLDELGVAEYAIELSSVRHKGVTNVTYSYTSFTPYDELRDWRGFQLLRSELDELLVQRAKRLGANVLFNHIPKSFVQDKDGKIVEIIFSKITIKPQYVIDATGRSGVLSKQLNIGIDYYSPKLLTYYGLVKCSNITAFLTPELHWDDSGWTWLAAIDSNTVSWARLDVFRTVDRKGQWLPEQIENGIAVGKVKAADVSWRISRQISGKNWFLIGDAAFVLDPTSSHGVINAIMGGMFVSYLIGLQSKLNMQEIHTLYNRWAKDTFNNDYKKMAKAYDEFFKESNMQCR